jgi:GrpB-like predicted nucleotidyltransferase (UPF0157 family)
MRPPNPQKVPEKGRPNALIVQPYRQPSFALVLPSSQTRKSALAVCRQLQYLLPVAVVSHIGSTALGIPGKPSINILVGVPNGQITTAVSIIEHWGGQPHPERTDTPLLPLRVVMVNGQAVHIQIADRESDGYARAIAIMNTLKVDGKLRQLYVDWKYHMMQLGVSEHDYMSKKQEFFTAHGLLQ